MLDSQRYNSCLAWLYCSLISTVKQVSIALIGKVLCVVHAWPHPTMHPAATMGKIRCMMNVVILINVDSGLLMNHRWCREGSFPRENDTKALDVSKSMWLEAILQVKHFFSGRGLGNAFGIFSIFLDFTCHNISPKPDHLVTVDVMLERRILP